jgi:hypothetical protein
VEARVETLPWRAGENRPVRKGSTSRDTWPLTPWAVAVWFVLLVALGVGTGLLLALSFGWPEWIAVALGGAFTGVYQQAFWVVLRSVQRRRR